MIVGIVHVCGDIRAPAVVVIANGDNAVVVDVVVGFV